MLYDSGSPALQRVSGNGKYQPREGQERTHLIPGLLNQLDDAVGEV